jgi:hypothetical protein
MTTPIQPMQFPPPEPAQTARTAYQIKQQSSITPFVRAKFGIGGGLPAAPSTSLNGFGPSSGNVAVPRLNPAQFGAP